MPDFVGFHHFYIGILFLLTGFIILITGSKTERRRKIALAIMFLGLVIATDDTIQHYKQYIDPTYRSPLHILYGATLYKIPLIRSLNTWFDNLLK
jgi:hypothetical protein